MTKAKGFSSLTLLAGLLVTAGAHAQSASAAAPLSIEGKWCSGSSSYNPPSRQADMVVRQPDGSLVVDHHFSKGEPAFARATEPMSGMVDGGKRPATLSGNKLAWVTESGWHYVWTIEGNVAHVSGQNFASQMHDSWDEVCTAKTASN